MILTPDCLEKFRVVKGKPKEITAKSTALEMKQGKVRLIALNNGNVYISEDGWYFGIELPKFIRKNAFGVSLFETIGEINLAIMDWGDTQGILSLLSNEQADILRKYLLTMR